MSDSLTAINDKLCRFKKMVGHISGDKNERQIQAGLDKTLVNYGVLANYAEPYYTCAG